MYILNEQCQSFQVTGMLWSMLKVSSDSFWCYLWNMIKSWSEWNGILLPEVKFDIVFLVFMVKNTLFLSCTSDTVASHAERNMLSWQFGSGCLLEPQLRRFRNKVGTLITWGIECRNCCTSALTLQAGLKE